MADRNRVPRGVLGIRAHHHSRRRGQSADLDRRSSGSVGTRGGTGLAAQNKFNDAARLLQMVHLEVTRYCDDARPSAVAKTRY